MRLEALDPVGALVHDVDLAELAATATATDTATDTDTDTATGDDWCDEWRDALAEHGVLVVRDQHLDDDDFAAFLRRFGDLQFTDGEQAVDGRDDLNVVTNVGRTRTPVSNWHVDTAYVSSPPSYTSLRAVEVPDEGGETLFANQYRAWSTLPGALRDLVRDRTMRHVVTGVSPTEGSETEASHPLVKRHPRTGRPALLLDAPARCGPISGLDDEASSALAAELLAHSTQDHNVWRHRWRPGDVVIWDNAAVLHRADHTGVVGDRTFHRGMVGAAGHGTSLA